MFQIALYDSDKKYLDFLSEKIKQVSFNYNIDIYICQFTSWESLIKINKKEQYHAVLLNAMLSSCDSIDIGKKLRSDNNTCCLIYYADDLSYALAGYTVPLFRYFVRTESDNVLLSYLDDLVIKLFEIYKIQKFVFRNGHKYINLSEIVFIECFAKRSVIHMLNGEAIESSEHINEIEEKLTGGSFVRVHKSLIVNASQIEWRKNRILCLTTGKELTIPRSHYDSVKKQLSNLMIII